MVDITHKSTTLRKAIAEATVRVSSEKTIEMLREQQIPKGNVLECSRVAALFAIKKTSDVIPDCHPLPIEFSNIHFELHQLSISISVEVHTIYRTGVEVEAMHGAAIAALTIYDMLKPVDKGVEIVNIRLREKSGGKSDGTKNYTAGLHAAVIVCSDSVFEGRKSDRSGTEVVQRLSKYSIECSTPEIVPDDVTNIRETTLKYCEAGVDLIVLSGGTGLSKRDVTREAITPLLETEIPGIAETMRAYGQERIPTALLSRSIAGLRGQTLIITLPGSTRAVQECMDAIFPGVLHVFQLIKNTSYSHE